MKGFMVMLLICSVTMSAAALFYMAATPLLAKHYSVKARYYSWLVIIIGLIIPFRPKFGNALVRVNVPDSPDEKPTYSTSKPSRAILPATSRNVSTLIWLVVDIAPPRSIS